MFFKNALWHLKLYVTEITKLFICSIMQIRGKNKGLVIVTGADSSHFKSCCQLLSSLYMHEAEERIIVYDLGMNELELKKIKEDYKKAEIRFFEYSEYPDYFDIKKSAGEYAWKPAILRILVDEFDCFVCWMDAGNVINKRLSLLRVIVKAIGMYSPYSSGNIAQWTHEKTLKYLNCPGSILKEKNLNGACVAIDCSDLIAKSIIYSWCNCSLEKECIAPNGSSRENHRQDQAALSVIAHQSGITRFMPGKKYGFKTHQDID